MTLEAMAFVGGMIDAVLAIGLIAAGVVLGVLIVGEFRERRRHGEG